MSGWIPINGILCVIVLFLASFIQPSLAQNVLPGSAFPEQVGKALRQEQEQRQPVISAPTITPPPAEAAFGGEAAKKITFKLNAIRLVGNRTFTDAQLRPLYQQKLGKEITVAELFEIVQAITNYYRNNGYIISRAVLPPQHVKNGVVAIQIIEGFIGKVTVSGDPKGAKCLVQAFGEQIRRCRPLQIKRMEKYLLLANEIPGTQVRAVLSPSKTTTGAADLTLVTQQQFITGYLSYDNYGTRYIGPQQTTANLGFNSLVTSGDFLQGTLVKTSRGKELTYIDVNYNAAVNDEGVRWLMGGTRVETRPGFVLEPLEISGLNSNYYSIFQFPYIRERSESLTFIAGFNYLDSKVTLLGEKLYIDHLRSLGAGLSYQFTDRYRGANIFYGDIRQGLPFLGYTNDTNPATAETSRPGGHADFTKVDLQISRLQTLTGPFSLFLMFKGQWAFSALLASEQFAFGGSQLGRGYDVAEIIGDTGAAGTVELRWNVPVGKWSLQNLQLYTFYDIGAIWNYKTIPDIETKASGTSIGIGARFYFTKYISGNLTYTQTLTRPVGALEIIGRGRRPRTWFSLVAAL